MELARLRSSGARETPRALCSFGIHAGSTFGRPTVYDLARQGTNLGQCLQLEEREMAKPNVLAHQLVLGLVELD
jgi:hypothetical protein